MTYLSDKQTKFREYVDKHSLHTPGPYAEHRPEHDERNARRGTVYRNDVQRVGL